MTVCYPARSLRTKGKLRCMPSPESPLTGPAPAGPSNSRSRRTSRPPATAIALRCQRRAGTRWTMNGICPPRVSRWSPAPVRCAPGDRPTGCRSRSADTAAATSSPGAGRRKVRSVCGSGRCMHHRVLRRGGANGCPRRRIGRRSRTTGCRVSTARARSTDRSCPGRRPGVTGTFHIHVSRSAIVSCGAPATGVVCGRAGRRALRGRSAVAPERAPRGHGAWSNAVERVVVARCAARHARVAADRPGRSAGSCSGSSARGWTATAG